MTSHELIQTQQTINATRLGGRSNDPYCYQIKPTYSSRRCNCKLQAMEYSRADESDTTNSQNWINQPTLYSGLLKLGQAKRIGKKNLNACDSDKMRGDVQLNYSHACYPFTLANHN